MNKIIQQVLTSIRGEAVGGVVSYFVTKKIVSDKYEETIESEIEKIKNHYRVLRKETVDLDKEATPEEGSLDLSEEEYEETREVMQEIIDKESYGENTNIFTEGPIPEHEVDTSPEFEELMRTRDTTKPFIITKEEFVRDGGLDTEVLNLTYYTKDDFLVDEQGGSVGDHEDLIGDQALTQFGAFSGDDDTVYVRDLKKNVDYEITRIYESFLSWNVEDDDD